MAICRTLSRGRAHLHLVGVEAAASARGGEELFALLRGKQPRHVLMESFSCPDAVDTGGEVSYMRYLNPRGLMRTSALMEQRTFRDRLSCEALGVLGAVNLGSTVLFADRLHTVSFDRLINRISLQDMLMTVAQATDRFAAVLERSQTKASSAQPAPWGSDAALQNVVCSSFPELWGERHRVMAHVARRALRQAADGGHVVAVVGATHVEPLEAALDGPEEADSAVHELLREPDIGELPGDEDGSLPPGLRVEVEKRAALAALLVSTRAFPAEYALPATEQLLPSIREVARPTYLRCRAAMRERLGSFDSFEGQQGLAAEAGGNDRVVTLGQLEEFCGQLADNGGGSGSDAGA